MNDRPALLQHVAALERQLSAMFESREGAAERVAELEGQWLKLERLLRAGFTVGPPGPGRYWWIEVSESSGDHWAGPTLAEAVAAAPEPEGEP